MAQCTACYPVACPAFVATFAPDFRAEYRRISGWRPLLPDHCAERKGLCVAVNWETNFCFPDLPDSRVIRRRFQMASLFTRIDISGRGRTSKSTL